MFIPGLVAAALAGQALLAQNADVGESQEQAELPPAPGYFIEAVVATTTAQQLIRYCQGIRLDIEAVQDATHQVMMRLNSDGFDISRPDGGMSGAQERIETAQKEFMLKHGLEGVITNEMVCAAARTEIADDTLVGSLLDERTE